MRYRAFANTRVRVSEIALGTMHFKWVISEAESLNLLDGYFEAGGNLIDTADMYSQWGKGLSGGEAESIIGKWLAQRKNRERIFLMTKVRARMWAGASGEGLGREHILRACEESLMRLQTDHVDVYMSHWPDEATPIEETMGAYQELVELGKARFIGLSNYPGKGLEEAMRAAEEIGLKYVCIEPHYNLLSRQPFEDEILRFARRHNLAVTPYSSLAGGFLSGAYRTGRAMPKTPRAAFAKEKMTARNLELIELLDGIGKKNGMSVAQVALAWLLRRRWITSIIIGPENTRQLREDLAASELSLKKGDAALIDSFTG